MLGFFFRHYDPWVDRFVVYDDGSTDGSVDILRAHPKVELRRFARPVADSFVLSHQAMQDTAWKESRRAADWVVVTAIDEHLHVKGRVTADYLAEQTRIGTTLIPALGFDMHHPEMPEDHGRLVDIVTRGRPRPAFNKLSIFDPNAVEETGFGPGRHAATPTGRLRLPERDEMMLWHYKHLGFKRNAEREARQAQRLGVTDRANGYGQHYLWSHERLRGFWDEMEREGRDLGTEAFELEKVAARPLWWRAPGFAPQLCTAKAPDPAISVLIKSYNHAAYVARTIESVLAQSFQDFEIIATDDGSTDGTADIVRSFADPRIRLEVLPRNGGIAAAMNATIARARGRYLAILNSDDWALPHRLQTQINFLDSHPEVSLLFGLPRAVDEAGAPTQAFNDFHLPLGFADASRRTWLRQFFFHGNCLCAPTAMIRREAYGAAGPYDPRLTNLPDLDMWIRMLLAGHRIHVLPEELTAFRIRDNGANASAPRPDNLLRTRFETTLILRHFAAMEADLYQKVFGDEDLEHDTPVALRIAELALRNPAPEYQHFGVQTYHEHARTPADRERLRRLAGALQSFAIAEPASQHAERESQELRRRILTLEQRNLELVDAAVVKDNEVGWLRQALTAEVQHAAETETAWAASLAREALAQHCLAAMRDSTSWKATAPLRAIANRIPGIGRGALREAATAIRRVAMPSEASADATGLPAGKAPVLASKFDTLR